MLETGALVAGRYEVEAVLGQGSAGVVLRCRDRQLDRLVAVKLVDGGVLGGVDRFLDEARALGALQHPNVVALYDHGVEDGRPYMALEWVTGGSLREQLGVRGFPLEEATRLCAQVLAALEAAHALGILHRDVKPENVLVSARGDAKLADFGLAKGERSAVRTATGMIVGTPEYLAPELFQGARATPASDVYSWGCLAYALVNRQPPHTGDLSSIVKASIRGKVRPGLESGPLQGAIRAALRPRPRDRPSVSELRAILAGKAAAKPAGRDSKTQVVSSAEVDLVPSGAPRSRPGAGSRPATRTRSAAWPITLGLGLAGMVGVVVWTVGPRGAPRELPPRTPTIEARRGEPARHAVARAWLERARELDAAALLKQLHAQVYSGEKNYQKVMFEVRERGPGPWSGVIDLEALRAAELPEVEELRGDAPELAGYLGDEGVPATDRFELYEALQGFDHVDGYFAGWGLPEPYGVAPMLAALVRSETKAHHKGETLGPMATANSPLPPGRHTIFEWDRLWDQAFP